MNCRHSLAITAFAFFRIVCTFESRSMRDSVLHASTFDCRQINLIVLGELVLAFLVTEFEVLSRYESLPLYAASTVCEPAVSVLVVKVAFPSASTTAAGNKLPGAVSSRSSRNSIRRRPSPHPPWRATRRT